VERHFDQELQSWDLALDSKKKTDSFMCGLVASRKDALVFIRDGFHEHCDINKVILTIRAWNRIYRGAKTKLIERVISGPAVVTMLQQTVTGMLAWPPKGKQKESKESCLHACVPDIRSGNVLLPLRADGTKPKWVVELVEELRTFPRSPHDDYVDAFSQAVNFLLPSARQDLDRAHEEAAATRPPLSPEARHREMLHALADKMARKKVEQLQSLQAGPGRRGQVIPFDTTTFAGLLAASGGVPQRRGRGMW
jgi:predicted phage terminase large subunit-like protein